MAFTFTVAGVAKSLQPGWRVSETLNGRNTMTFSVLSLDGTYRPASRAAVVFDDGGTTLFAGTIHDKDEAGLGGYGVTPISTSCGATDYNALPDRRQVELTIPAGSTLKQALVLVTAYLSGYSVTLHASQVDGPTFTDALVFEFGPLTSVLNKLSVITGYTWNISYTSVLRMRAPGAEAAPFNIAAGDGNTIGDITVSPSLSDYANQVIVRFSEAARAAYAFLSASGNFANTETVTVGGKVYTFQTVLTNVDGNVLIGADAEASLTNLSNAITLGSGSGTTYAAAMSVNGSVTALMQSASLMKAVALASGVSGNSIACTETAANASWITEGGGGTTTLLFGADESLTNFVTATSSPAAADLVEAVFSHPEVRDTATAQALADGYLDRSVVEPREIRYRTLVSGLHPGMSQTIVEAKRSLNASCLITSVDITANGNVLWYDVTASEGLVIPTDYKETFRSWNGSGSGAGVSAVLSGGGGGTLSGSGTIGKIPKWSGTEALTDSIMSESAGVLTVTGAATVTGGVTIGTTQNLALVAGDVSFVSNSGYGLKSADGTRVLTVTNAGVDTTALTIASAYVYRAAGTDVPVSDGGTGASTAADARTNLGLVIGTNVQAWDADLTTWAGVTPGTGIAAALAVNVGSAGAPVLFNGALGTPSSGTLTNATGLPWAGVLKTGSSLADLATRAVANLSDGANVALLNAANVFTGGAQTFGTLVGVSGGKFGRSSSGIMVLGIPGTSASEGFSIVDSAGSQKFEVLGDGATTVRGQLNVVIHVLPTINWTSDLGSQTLKVRTIYAAELEVDTLVAQDVIATIGGEILTAQTTKLTAAIGTGDTTIYVEHNDLASGDRIWLEARGNFEMMAVTSGPSGAGPYSYTVTRNLDTSGANAWIAGDAVVNTGTTGDGYIHQYATSGTFAGNGPTIVGQVRTGTAYNAIATRWAIGNLDGLYGYSGATYGAAFGDNSAAWVKIDATNGIRIGHNATTKISLTAAGDASFAGAITASSGTIGSFTIGTYLYTGSKTAYNDANTGVHVGSDGLGIGNNVFTVSSAGALTATNATIVSASGTVTIGSSGISIAAQSSLFGSGGAYAFTPNAIPGSQFGVQGWEQGGGLDYRWLNIDNITTVNKRTISRFITDNSTADPVTVEAIAYESGATLTSSWQVTAPRIFLTGAAALSSTLVVSGNTTGPKFLSGESGWNMLVSGDGSVGAYIASLTNTSGNSTKNYAAYRLVNDSVFPFHIETSPATAVDAPRSWTTRMSLSAAGLLTVWGNILPSASGAHTIGASGTPFGELWVNQIVVDTATGGGKGAGTANFKGDIYKNNTAFTNPKWALQHFFHGTTDTDGPYAAPADYTGLMPIEAHREATSAACDLPLMLREKDGGIFARGDMLLASLEEAYLYIYQLHDRITALESVTVVD